MTLPNETTGGGRTESHWSLMFSSLRYPDYFLLWTGSVAEHLGEMMQLMTILWMVNEMTHSPLLLTVVGSARAIPMIFFPILGGVVADRVNRRNLLIAALAASALFAMVLVVLVVIDVIAIWHLIVISLLGGVANSFNHPARSTIMPNLVKKEHLLNAISLDTFSVQAVAVMALPLTGYLIVSLGLWPIFVIRTVGVVIAIFLVYFIKSPLKPPAISKEQTIMLDLAEGFRYLRGNPIVLGLLLLFTLPMIAMGTIGNLMPVIAENILNVGAIGYGYLRGATGLGAILSLIILAMLTYYKDKHKLLLGSGIISGIVLLGFSGSQWFFLSLPLLVIIGVMNTTFRTIITTLVQGFIPDGMRGRVMSWRDIAMGLGPVLTIGFGWVAQTTGVPFSLALLGGVTLVVSFLLLALVPKFKTLEQAKF